MALSDFMQSWSLQSFVCGWCCWWERCDAMETCDWALWEERTWISVPIILSTFSSFVFLKSLACFPWRCSWFVGLVIVCLREKFSWNAPKENGLLILKHFSLFTLVLLDFGFTEVVKLIIFSWLSLWKSSRRRAVSHAVRSGQIGTRWGCAEPELGENGANPVRAMLLPTRRVSFFAFRTVILEHITKRIQVWSSQEYDW